MKYAGLKFRQESLADGRDAVWPALVNVYQEQGYEAGYARGGRDALAAALEAVEDFLRTQPDVDTRARQLIYDFTEFLESRIQTAEPRESHGTLIDGLGI